MKQQIQKGLSFYQLVSTMALVLLAKGVSSSKAMLSGIAHIVILKKSYSPATNNTIHKIGATQDADVTCCETLNCELFRLMG